MSILSRREALASLAAALVAPRVAKAGPPAGESVETITAEKPLALADFQPKSMLHLPENAIVRSQFPVIDIHTHISSQVAHNHNVPIGEKMTYAAPPAELLRVMDRTNVRMMVDLTGGFGTGLAETIERYQHPYPDRFAIFTTPCWERVAEPGYPQYQADQIAAAHAAGALGLKVLKTLGLFLREQVGTGRLVKIDDHRFDPMWEACDAAGLPVAIHVSDPEAFFLPIDRFNERYEELHSHPDWSYHGGDFPSNQEILEARNRVFARHPKTQFIALHVGNNAENLGYVAQCLDRFPNMQVDLAARVGELGRQPHAARKFFEKYQDRILFGTDASPHTTSTPQQLFCEELYQIYFRFLETDDEYFDYAPALKPPQGRWRISGIGLPETILKKVYFENAARLLGLTIL